MTDSNSAIVTRLSAVRKHPNADRLKLATVLGTQVIVGLESQDGDLVLYFDSNLRLSPEYLRANNLYTKKELNADPAVKGYFGSNGRVRVQKFRGELSNGYVAPIESLSFTGKTDGLTEGTEFTSINGVNICAKYVIPLTRYELRQLKHNTPKSVMFWRHWDTKQFMREWQSIPEGILYIEEKIHGTSGRTGKVLCKTNHPWWMFWQPKEEWKVVSGTRRMDTVDGHLPVERKQIEERLAPHLHCGEQVYYEIFGHTLTGQDIQSDSSYGCIGGQYKVLLYRVTITTPDGFCFDLPREQVYRRAQELGLESPVLLTRCNYDRPEQIEIICSLAHGKSSLDANTLCEGIVVWFQRENGEWDALKHKSVEFLLFEEKQREREIGDPEDSL